MTSKNICDIVVATFHSIFIGFLWFTFKPDLNAFAIIFLSILTLVNLFLWIEIVKQIKIQKQIKKLQKELEELKKPISPDMVDDEDPLIRQIIADVWNSGNTISATVDENGKVTKKVITPESK